MKRYEYRIGALGFNFNFDGPDGEEPYEWFSTYDTRDLNLLGSLGFRMVQKIGEFTPEYPAEFPNSRRGTKGTLFLFEREIDE